MRQTIHELLLGNESILLHFKTAKLKWLTFFRAFAERDTIEWADWLSSSQIPFFERQCGGRDLGQEIMAWSGFGILNDPHTGIKNMRLAQKLAKAFDDSQCSAEVKFGAEEATRFYQIRDE